MDGEVGYDSYNSPYVDHLVPMEEFSTEDNQLLMSVLNSANMEDNYGHNYSMGGSEPRWAFQQNRNNSSMYRDDGKKHHPPFVQHTNRDVPMQHMHQPTLNTQRELNLKMTVVTIINFFIYRLFWKPNAKSECAYG